MPAVQPQVALPPRYRVVRHIANGGMAAVWAAEDEMLERLVAVKVLAAGYAADPAARRRFTREARAAARVSDHQHVVTVYDIGETTSQPPEAFIVMEHFAGGSVADRLRNGDSVPVPTALDWLEQAADALDTAHAADIVHRDVKPGNLLLDERGRLAVGDFGIASLAGETAVTQAGQVLGTAAYLSPEQARGRPATPASDRYSLAVVAYELLCGRRPFDGDTPVAQARAHVEVEPPAPTGPCEAAAGVLKHGLSKDPAGRPRTATAFVEGLRRALGDHAEPRRAEPATAATRRMAAGAAGGAAVGAAGAAAASPRFARPGAARTPTSPPRDERRVPEPTGLVRRGPEPAGPARRGTRRAVPLAILAALCLIGGAAAALISDSGNNSGGGNGGGGDSATTAARSAGTPSASKPKKQSKKPKAGAAPAATTPAAQPPATTQPAPATGGSPVSLNNQGYAMLPGNPQGAVPLLQRAVTGFRDAGRTGELDYAYSLYNLGWALRLAGRPAEAIPYLEERLRISSYKRGIVENELRTARRQAGQGGGSGNGNGGTSAGGEGD